jgi:hypothetical protein
MTQTKKSQLDKYEHPKFPAEEFKKEDYIHLWQYFSDRTDTLTDRLWTIATWLFGFNSAILGFIFVGGSRLIIVDSTNATITAPEFVLTLALAGCGLCLFAILLIENYGAHIQRNRKRAEELSENLHLVKETLAGSSSTGGDKDSQRSGLQTAARNLTKKLPPWVKRKEKLPSTAEYLIGFSVVYFAVFLTIAVFSFLAAIISVFKLVAPLIWTSLMAGK